MPQIRPNVLYFVAHDLGRFLGCYDRPVLSPNLDRFARHGVKFTNAYCSSPCCGPSRVCAMTAKYPQATGTIGLGNWGWLLPKEEPTLVDYYNEAEYETVHIGFCHERQYGEMRYQIDGKKGDERHWKCSAELAVDTAIDYLRRRDTRRPFYMNLATNHAHLGSVATHDQKHGNPVPPEDAWIPPNVPDSARLRQWFSRWYASVYFLDTQFGRLMSALDEFRLRENTLIVFTTDHGAYYHRGKGSVYDLGTEIALMISPPKGLRRGYSIDHLIPNIDFMPTWLEACNLPIPGGIQGRSFWSLLNGTAYTPHDAIFVQRNYHGELKTAVNTKSYGTREIPTESKYVDFYDPMRAVRTPEFHYIRNFLPDARKRDLYCHEIDDFVVDDGIMGSFLPPASEARPAEELYHITHDPWEQINLAARPEYRRVKDELAGRLNSWQHETGDFLLTGNIPKPLIDPPQWPY